ncbi:MAG: VOC family protein [Chloroflexi bacterium]|nr:VOC family protein [Chloroflexota bacterium]
MQKITPYLWFDNQAEEAIRFYTSLFPNSRIVSISRLPGEAPGVDGAVLTATFELNGREFMALNGGPQFKFNESISLFVDCDSQEEVDRLWNALTADGGEESQCGWLKDKYGLSWQIIPEALMRLMSDPNATKAGAVMQAMLQMQKIDVATLQAAYDGA